MSNDHEYSVTVPRMYREPSSEPELVIGISAHGGGTPGESYRDNGWSYSVYRDGTEVISGDDLRSGGMGGTHEEMARTLCSFLTADAESLSAVTHGRYTEDPDRLSVYSDSARELLESESERFSLFSDPGSRFADMSEPEPGMEPGQ